MLLELEIQICLVFLNPKRYSKQIFPIQSYYFLFSKPYFIKCFQFLLLPNQNIGFKRVLKHFNEAKKVLSFSEKIGCIENKKGCKQLSLQPLSRAPDRT